MYSGAVGACANAAPALRPEWERRWAPQAAVRSSSKVLVLKRESEMEWPATRTELQNPSSSNFLVDSASSSRQPSNGPWSNLSTTRSAIDGLRWWIMESASAHDDQ